MSDVTGTLFHHVRVWRIESRVWVTTGGKDHFTLTSRWSLIRAAFSRKDVHLG